MSALLRLINREGTEEDEIALLDYLAMSAHRHLSTFTRRIRMDVDPGGPDGDGQNRQATINLEELAPEREFLFPVANDIEADSYGRMALERVFAQLRRRLLGYVAPTGRVKQGLNRGTSGDETREDEEDVAGRKRFRNSLEYFEKHIQELIDTSVLEEGRRAALVIWLEVKLRILLRHLECHEDALRFIKNWFWEACTKTTIAPEAGPLEQHVFSIAAICASLSQKTGSNISSSTPGKKLLSKLHEALERFCMGPVAEKQALEALFDHPEISYAGWLVGDHPTDLHNNLRLVLETKTIREELTEAIAQFEAGKKIPKTPPVKSDIWEDFLSKLQRATLRSIIYKNQVGDQAACAHCHMRLNTKAEQDLDTYRIARCESCGKFTIRLKP